ncbi:acyl-CoA desaturase [Aurantiacibacter spongiae]|uniref:Acyl-CoA desaturase n=1 Tax=Aurantiacibacter spongiae TaxID=2488860 RepID=A0A3N5CT99_9SPHN|nr:acyl-CoA desaturase [Aurantiacibacter spongiae]RPF72404.1 acyl-CoA desaturase [Aurantiacibacter spongiae]
MDIEARDRCEVNWIVDVAGADAVAGRVRWDPVHSLWNGGMLVVALLAGPLLFSWGALAAFVVLTGLAVLLGHSIGFHRLLIHGSFRTSRPLRLSLVWWGTLAGMSGPLWIVRTHDLRDWAQRQPACHPYLSHRSGLLRDAWWQLHCRLELDSPPRFDLSPLHRDRAIRWLERTWMWQQLPVAALLWIAGGWGFVVWGVCARVAITVHGHWFVGYLAHRRGPQSWLVADAGVQAHDVPWAAILTMGEAWHNNHHAFPGSARIGLRTGQSDWGYAVIRAMERAGLAWDVCLPADMPGREAALREIGPRGLSQNRRTWGVAS